MGPEAGAVLADAPAFGFELAVAAGGFQGVGGDAVLAVGFGVEDGEVLAEDFGFFVAFAAFGADIPGCDPAFGVEHEDGVVGDGVDEQAVAFAIQR